MIKIKRPKDEKELQLSLKSKQRASAVYHLYKFDIFKISLYNAHISQKIICYDYINKITEGVYLYSIKDVYHIGSLNDYTMDFNKALFDKGPMKGAIMIHIKNTNEVKPISDKSRSVQFGKFIFIDHYTKSNKMIKKYCMQNNINIPVIDEMELV